MIAPAFANCHPRTLTPRHSQVLLSGMTGPSRECSRLHGNDCQASPPNRSRVYTLSSTSCRSSTMRLATIMSASCLKAARSLITRELRSEEHTSELQSRPHLVCRLLLEKKKKY